MKKILLCILDGFGYSNKTKHNAIALARKPNLQRLFNEYPHSLLEASGKFVGLPDGQIGNSEVGHFTIGAGRILFQDLPRISKAFAENKVAKMPQILDLIEYCKATRKKCHIMGIASDGGVHGHIDHMIALAQLVKNSGVEIRIHAITDGRDTAPKSALNNLKKFTEHNLEISSISGRFYAMDRDNRWDRTKRAYDAIFSAECATFKNYEEYINAQYKTNITDEFIEPAVKVGYTGFEDEDAIVFCNFRADRARQIFLSLLDKSYNEFISKKYDIGKALAFTTYSKELSSLAQTLFPKEVVKNSLGEVIASHNLTQLRIAETEKYAHVTYFFNGGEEKIFPKEERILVSSPKVKTYDETPQMSAIEITDKLIASILQNHPDFICLNFANPDMVGHTGNLQATIEAIDVIDTCIERLEKICKEKGYDLIITSDHGNAEEMFDEKTNQAMTAHTLNRVPFLYVSSEKNITLKDGSLADIAPTILKIMGIAKPLEMTGSPLF